MSDEFLKLVKTLSWTEVFSIWRDGESSLPRWIAHYRESGFASWDAWRTNTLKDLRYDGLSWTLFEIVDPLRHVPEFVGGPFRAWIAKYYEGRKSPVFREIVKTPALRGNPIVQEMASQFPHETCLIGLQTDRGIVVIEGMHRCCALALLAETPRTIDSKVSIALARYCGEVPEMGRADSPT